MYPSIYANYPFHAVLCFFHEKEPHIIKKKPINYKKIYFIYFYKEINGESYVSKFS